MLVLLVVGTMKAWIPIVSDRMAFIPICMKIHKFLQTCHRDRNAHTGLFPYKINEIGQNSLAEGMMFCFIMRVGDYACTSNCDRGKVLVWKLGFTLYTSALHFSTGNGLQDSQVTWLLQLKMSHNKLMSCCLHWNSHISCWILACAERTLKKIFYLSELLVYL
jgi:hypothetical protein